MRRLQHRDVKELAYRHTASKWQNQDLNILTPEPMLLTSVLHYHVAVASPFHCLSGSFLIRSLRV